MSLSVGQREQLLIYVRMLADMMDLKDWRLSVAEEPVDSSAQASAQVSAVAGRKMAEIEFCADFSSMSREDQRIVVVHELIHLHFEPMAIMSDNIIKKILGRESAGVFKIAFLQELEYGVDGLALAISPLFPLPPSLKKP